MAYGRPTFSADVGPGSLGDPYFARELHGDGWSYLGVEGAGDGEGRVKMKPKFAMMKTKEKKKKVKAKPAIRGFRFSTPSRR